MKTYRGVILSRSSLGYTVRIPTLYDSVFGPLECITPDKGLSPVYELGDQVIVVQASSDNDDLVILGYRTVGGQGGGPVEVTWDTIAGKPATFPPSAHSHTWDSITSKPTTFPPAVHAHAWADITSKPTTFAPIIGTTSTTAKAGNYVPTWGEVTSKPATFAPSAHGHAWSEITGTPATFPSAPHVHSWGDISAKPTLFPPESHTHPWSQVTGTPSTYPPSAHSHSWAETTGKPTTFAPAPHSHVVADIPSLPYSNVQTAPTIPDATNLNIYETDGVWICTSTAFASLANNYPIVQGGLLEVHTAGPTHIFQRYTSFTPSSQRFHRTRIDTAWSAWSVAALWAEVGSKPSTFPSTWATVSGKPATYPPDSHTHTWGQITGIPTTFAPSTHTHTWAQVTGTPATYPPTIGTTSVTAKAGDYVPTWAEITSKPTTFAPIIGTTSTTAKAGDYIPTWAETSDKPSTFAPSAHNHDLATSSVDGFMAKADKALLDTATFSPTANSMMRRHSSGSVQVETGTSAKDAANKAYVDDYNLLWTGAVYMSDGQSVTYTGGQTVLAQKTGIYLVWSNYSAGAPQNDSWVYQFVPKWHVSTAPGTGVYTIMNNSGNVNIQKYVYVGNTAISGNAMNGNAPNNSRVLRAVIGV